MYIHLTTQRASRLAVKHEHQTQAMWAMPRFDLELPVDAHPIVYKLKSPAYTYPVTATACAPRFGAV